MPNYPVRIGSSLCGCQQPLLLIAGPCVLEDEAGALEIAQQLLQITHDLEISLISKPRLTRQIAPVVNRTEAPDSNVACKYLTESNR